MKDADIFEKVKNIEREIRELCDKRYRDGVNDGFDDGYNQGYFDAKGTKDDEISEQRCKSKMTIDEAITHCEEVADSKCDECGAEHRQLAEWLKELKRLREQTRWIPVSERPPETDDEVIAYDGADAFVAWYGVNGWHSTDNRFDPRVPIIEWKPINLPKAEEKTNDSCWKEYYESKFMKKF